MKTNRPNHPKCPACGKAMYKQMGGKRVKKTAPWTFCRDTDCLLYGKNQAAKPRPARQKARAAEPELAPAPVPMEPRKANGEHPALQKARDRIRKAINEGGRYGTNVIGLTLTIVAQEMGNDDVADKLIDEYNLTELFGVQKQSDISE